MQIPTLEEVKNDYVNVVALVKDVKDVSRLRQIERDNHITIEINGMEDRCDNWNQDLNVEWVRVESFNSLQYVYFWYDASGKCTNIMFDVWCDEIDNEFITDVTFEKLEEKYKEGIKWILHRKGISYEEYAWNAVQGIIYKESSNGSREVLLNRINSLINDENENGCDNLDLFKLCKKLIAKHVDADGNIVD